VGGERQGAIDNKGEMKKMLVMKNKRIPQSVAYCG